MRWTLITYDYDEVFGLGSEESLVSTPYQNFTRPNSERPLVEVYLESPFWRSEFERILQTLIKRFFKSSVIDPRLDAWQTMLRADVEWDLSLPVRSPGSINTTWTIWNFDNNIQSTDGQVMGLKEWVSRRSTAVCEQLGFTNEDDLAPLGQYNPDSRLPPHEQTTLEPSTASIQQYSIYWLFLTAFVGLCM